MGIPRLTLELHDGKARHLPEVAKVGSTNAETEFKRGHAAFATSLEKSGSMVAVESSGSSAMHSEMVRRTGSVA